MTHGSLSTGICGFDIGAEANGIRTKWTCEIEPLRQDIIKWLIPKARHYGDMRRVRNPAYVDIISFGFPCQDVSRANPRGQGIQGLRSGLWYAGFRIICRVRPKYIIIENSPDLVFKGLGEILAQLASQGYDAEWDVISCQRFGMPHIRKRLFLVAYTKEERMDQKQVLNGSTPKKHRTKAAQERTEQERVPVWAGSGGIHRPAFWTEMLSKFHHLDNGLPREIYNGLVAAAGDTVSPIITEWIFSRIKKAEKEKVTVQ